MWDKVIIGEGNKGNSSYKCWEPSEDIKNPCNLSENGKAFWITMPNVLNGFHTNGMTVFCNTKEGEMIETLLSDKRYEEMNDYILSLFLSNLPAQEIIRIIENKFNEGLEEGKKIKAREIKRCLNIDEY